MLTLAWSIEVWYRKNSNFCNKIYFPVSITGQCRSFSYKAKMLALRKVKWVCVEKFNRKKVKVSETPRPEQTLSKFCPVSGPLPGRVMRRSDLPRSADRPLPGFCWCWRKLCWSRAWRRCGHPSTVWRRGSCARSQRSWPRTHPCKIRWIMSLDKGISLAHRWRYVHF